jgi:hypothetical protein
MDVLSTSGLDLIINDDLVSGLLLMGTVALFEQKLTLWVLQAR